MKKLVVVVIALALIGAVVGAWAVMRSSPERRLCTKLGDLCGVEGGYDDLDACVKDVEALGKTLGEERLDRAAQCVDEATSCSMAAGCLAGTGLDVMKDVAKDFLEGILKSRDER